jgi:hypothetical protein
MGHVDGPAERERKSRKAGRHGARSTGHIDDPAERERKSRKAGGHAAKGMVQGARSKEH